MQCTPRPLDALSMTPQSPSAGIREPSASRTTPFATSSSTSLVSASLISGPAVSTRRSARPHGAAPLGGRPDFPRRRAPRRGAARPMGSADFARHGRCRSASEGQLPAGNVKRFADSYGLARGMDFSQRSTNRVPHHHARPRDTPRRTDPDNHQVLRHRALNLDHGEATSATTPTASGSCSPRSRMQRRSADVTRRLTS